MKKRSYQWGIRILIVAGLMMPIPIATAASTDQDQKTELVHFATGPGGETNPNVLRVRSVEVETPDSDGQAALKTVGTFLVDFVTLPFQIVKVLWESATE